MERKWCEAIKHISFIVAIYRRQLREGRWFLREHPVNATSWALEEVRKLMEEEGVICTIADQCVYGLMTRGPRGKWVPAQKKTRFMTNSQGIAAQLGRKCPGRHEHQQLLSGSAGPAARYPQGLCEVICRGLLTELEWRSQRVKCLMRIKEIMAVEAGTQEDHEEEEA